MKLKIALTLFLLTSTCWAAKSSAQTHSPHELQKELKALEPMLGTWAFKGKLPDELSPNLEKRCLGELDGGIVVERLFAKDQAGKDHQISLTVWRWDDKKGKLVSVSFSYDGVHKEAVHSINATNPSKPTITSIDSKPGSPIATRQTVTILDSDTHGWKIEATVGDGPIVDGVWKKQ